MRLALVAASGLAREVVAALHGGAAYDEVVLLDDDPARWETDVAGFPVVGGLDLLPRLGEIDVLVCAGRGSSREAIVARLAGRGVGTDRYGTVVHPSVEVPPGCTVGAGSILLAGVVLTADVRVGRHVVLMPHSTLTHDDVVDDFATICAGVALGGRVHVGRGAYLGMNASVREDVSVGPGATLGMGAALTVDLPARQTWVGVPAAPLTVREAIA